MKTRRAELDLLRIRKKQHSDGAPADAGNNFAAKKPGPGTHGLAISVAYNTRESAETGSRAYTLTIRKSIEELSIPPRKSRPRCKTNHE